VDVRYRHDHRFSPIGNNPQRFFDLLNCQWGSEEAALKDVLPDFRAYLRSSIPR
jgi:hypothetical protein